jgi:hypothetical protein
MLSLINFRHPLIQIIRQLMRPVRSCGSMMHLALISIRTVGGDEAGAVLPGIAEQLGQRLGVLIDVPSERHLSADPVLGPR